MTLRLKDPFQLPLDAEAGLSLTGVSNVLNAASELRELIVSTSDANASLSQRVLSIQMPQMDHADNVFAVFTHHLLSSDKDFLHWGRFLAPTGHWLTIKWQTDKEP